MARGLGISSTPTFFINGKSFVGQLSADKLNAAIDEALDPGSVAAASATGAVSVGKLDLSRAPVRGQSQASITIIEFSDLQCPFCARVTPTLQELMKQYPDQVRWVFKNFPLDFHADSPLAHAAALAAGRQGKFWEMHDLIFANQHTLKRDSLLSEARSLNLDMDRFTADLDSDDMKRNSKPIRKKAGSLASTVRPHSSLTASLFPGPCRSNNFRRRLITN